jgi:hypothetical protein
MQHQCQRGKWLILGDIRAPHLFVMTIMSSYSSLPKVREQR